MSGKCSPAARLRPCPGGEPTVGQTPLGDGGFTYLPAPAVRAELRSTGELLIRQVSNALVALFSAPPGDFNGAPLAMLFPEEAVLDAVRSIAHGRDEATNSVAAQCRVGDALVPVTVAVSALPAEHGALASGEPVGELNTTVLLVLHLDESPPDKAAERASRESEKRLRDMVDNVSALMYLKRLDGQYAFINRHYERLLGIKREFALGKTDYDLWPTPIASIYRADDKAVHESERAMEFEEPIPGAHGGLGMWLSLKFPIFDEDGSLYGVGGISTDISERNRAAAAVREARDEAERANRAKSDFLSRMSHELRTPLNSILGFGQLLRMETLPSDAAGPVDSIVKAGDHLLSLINEVLELSRIEAGEQRFSIETVHVCDPLIEAVELVRPLAAERDIDLARDLHGGLSTYVLADYQRLTQVLLNLLMNAVKYNRPGGVVTISVETSEHRARIRVVDTGLGMDGADVDRIFLPFERLSPDTSWSEEGTGLGLALARSMINLMGGALGVEQTVKGRGSVFYIELPITSAPLPAPERNAEAVVEAERLDLSQYRILYIEDNPDNLELVRRVLFHAGEPDLITALRGQRGVELAVSSCPDLVLLDLHLPDLGGEEVLAQLRSDRNTCDIPVVVLSADAVPSQEQRLVRAGAAGYLTKPFDIAKFVDVIGCVLREQA